MYPRCYLYIYMFARIQSFPDHIQFSVLPIHQPVGATQPIPLLADFLFYVYLPFAQIDFFLSFFCFRFSFSVYLPFFCSSRLPLSFFPLSPILASFGFKKLFYPINSCSGSSSKSRIESYCSWRLPDWQGIIEADIEPIMAS